MEHTDTAPMSTPGVAALSGIGGAQAITGKSVSWDNLAVTAL